jgi:hypothetical protein
VNKRQTEYDTENATGLILRKSMKSGDIFETLSIEDTVGHR